MKRFYNKAIFALRPNASFVQRGSSYSGLEWLDKSSEKPSEQEIENKIQEFLALEPMRLLRIQRDQLLQQTDWEITRGLEEGLNIDSLKTYRTALRNLPQQIEAGEITAPTLDDNGILVFEHWPERTDA